MAKVSVIMFAGWASRRSLPPLARRGKIHLSNALSAQYAVNVWITSSSSTSVTCVASYLLMFDIITSGELISRSTKTVRRPVQYRHPPPAKSLPLRNSAVSTIGTNVEPPEIRYGGTVMLSPVLLRSFGSATAPADRTSTQHPAGRSGRNYGRLFLVRRMKSGQP
jgi:hypothetical protein